MTTEMEMNKIYALEEDANYEGAFALCINALKNDPQNKDLLEKTASIAKIVGNNEKSIECYEKVLELEPNNQIAYSELQDLYIDVDKFKYYTMRAKFRLMEQKIEAAIDDFKKSLPYTDDEKLILETRLSIANLYLAINKGDKAEDQYLMILDTMISAEASLQLASYYVRIEDNDAAIDVLKRAYNNDSDNIELKKALGDLYLRAGDHENASKYVVDEYSNAKLLLSQGKNEEAKKVIDNYSGKKDGKYYLLKAEYHYNLKEVDECFAVIDEFAKQSPKNPLIFQMRALCYELQENQGRAKYNWGWYNLMKGQNDVALAEFEDSNNIEQSADAITQIIRLYDLQNEKTVVVDYLEELVELEPNNTLALKRLAEFYKSMGDIYKADDYYAKILEYDPNNMSVLPVAAKVAEKTGRTDDAIKYYESISKNTRDEKEKENALRRIRVINGEEDDSIVPKILEFFKKFI